MRPSDLCKSNTVRQLQKDMNMDQEQTSHTSKNRHRRCGWYYGREGRLLKLTFN
jgi:hypothetical protein